MKERIERRVAELRAEYEKGAAVLANLEREHTKLEQTLLRIGGAIQVCEELLAQPAPAAPEPAGEE